MPSRPSLLKPILPLILDPLVCLLKVLMKGSCGDRSRLLQELSGQIMSPPKGKKQGKKDEALASGDPSGSDGSGTDTTSSDEDSASSAGAALRPKELHVRCKTLKMLDEPTVEELTAQVSLISIWLEHLVRLEHGTDFIVEDHGILSVQVFFSESGFVVHAGIFPSAGDLPHQIVNI